MSGTRSGKEAFAFRDQITGREVVQLTNHRERSVHGYDDLRPWSRIDGRLAFTSMVAPSSPEGDVYLMDRDGGNIQYVAHSHATDPNSGARVQWYPDGTRIIFQDRQGDERVVTWLDVRSGASGSFLGDLRMVSPVDNLQVYDTPVQDYPAPSLLSRRDEDGVFIMDLMTGASRRLCTFGECMAIHPRRDELERCHFYVKKTQWSLDGRRILFGFTNQDYCAIFGEPLVKDLYIVNADGSGLKYLGPYGTHPAWSADGTAILSRIRLGKDAHQTLVLRDAATAELRTAFTCIAGHGHPSYSPNGQWVAMDYVNQDNGRATIFVIDTQADIVQEVARVRVHDHSHRGTNLHPCWSWDSQELLYASDATGVAQLCVVRI